jgi:predicted DNA-binding transcriptional regulator AlpA
MSRDPLSPRILSLPRFAMRREEAAASVAVSPTKWDEWVKDGRMPKGLKIDGVVLWDTAQVLDAWERLRDTPQSSARNAFDGVVA